MKDIAENQSGYAAAGPWDRLGSILRTTLAVLFLVITVVFFATAQDGLVSVGDAGTAVTATASASN